MLLLVAAMSAQAGENPDGRTSTGDVGDALQVIIPTVTLGAAIVRKDWQGARELTVGTLSTLGATYVLKESINKDRPDGRSNDSFPSSHTAVSFHAAAFIQERYGWKWSVPAFLAASWVGHSRVHDKRHDEQDVIAGAVLGIVSARIFTTSYEGVEVAPDVGEDYVGLRFSYRY